MPGNKYRVSVAGFVRDRVSNGSCLEKDFGRAMYHWGIWVEPKNSNGAGRLYHMEEHQPMNSRFGPIPGASIQLLGQRRSISRNSWTTLTVASRVGTSRVTGGIWSIKRAMRSGSSIIGNMHLGGDRGTQPRDADLEKGAEPGRSTALSLLQNSSSPEF